MKKLQTNDYKIIDGFFKNVKNKNELLVKLKDYDIIAEPIPVPKRKE